MHKKIDGQKATQAAQTNLNEKEDKKQIRKGVFLIQNGEEPPFQVKVSGRVMWALESLIEGPCTPVERPAPRWSDYVFRLRNEGVKIHTEHEVHGGEFAGTHGKYHLLSKVTPIVEAA